MPDFTAQDVKRLRDATGAGMMDAKRALLAAGDYDSAAQWLREQGLASSAKRETRESGDGALALASDENAAVIVELRCETDFVAKTEQFTQLVDELAHLVLSKGIETASERQTEIDDLKVSLKENIVLGRVERVEAAEGSELGTYLHVQNGRGKLAVIVELQGGDTKLAHDIAVHTAFARPPYVSREDVPDEVLQKERSTFEAIARNEGKPDAALPKIIEGRLNGFYKENCLLDQPYVKDEKQTISQLVGSATVKRVVWITIGR